MPVAATATALRLSLGCLALCLLLRPCGQPQPSAPRQKLQRLTRPASMELLERAVKVQSNVRRLPVSLGSFDGSVRSPDGKWSLESSHEERVVRAADGSRLVRRSPKAKFWARASDTLWLRDSRRWVTLMAGDQSLYAVIEGLDHAGAIRQVPIGNPRCTISWPDLMPSRLLGLVGNRVLAKASRDYYEGSTKMPFYSFSISGGPPVVREFTIAWPRGASDWDEVALSPRGDCLAWLFYFRRSRSPSDGQVKEVRLMLSRPDGSRMRTIAKMRIAESAKADRQFVHYNSLPREIGWLGDGSLSFMYQNARWKIPLG